MQIKTIKDWKYYVQSKKTGTISTEDGVILTSFSAGDQYYFTAPYTGYVDCSDDDASVYPTFGEQQEFEEQNDSVAATSLSDVYSARDCSFEPIHTGESQQTIGYWVYLARAHAPIGTVTQVSWAVPTDTTLSASNFTAHYLVIYEIITPATTTSDTVYRFVGCSTEAKTQVMGEIVAFEFTDAHTEGGDLQLSLTDSPVVEGDPIPENIEADNFFYCNSTPITSDDKFSAIIVVENNALAAAERVMECSFEVESPAKFVTEDRVVSRLAAHEFEYKGLQDYSLIATTDATRLLEINAGSVLDLDLTSIEDDAVSVTIQSITITGAASDKVATAELWLYPASRGIIWPDSLIWLDGSAPSLSDNTNYRFAIRQEANGNLIINLAYSYSTAES